MPKTTQLAGQAGGRDSASRSLRAALFERIMCRVQRYFYKLVWDQDAVDDCVQNTFLRLERSLSDGSYDPRQSFNTWMWLKAHAVFVDYCRQKHHGFKPLQPQLDSPVASGQAQVEAKLDAVRLLQHLRSALASQAFEAFVLYYDEQLTISHIASLQQRDRKTVSKELQASKRQALKFLEG